MTTNQRSNRQQTVLRRRQVYANFMTTTQRSNRQQAVLRRQIFRGSTFSKTVRFLFLFFFLRDQKI